MSKTAEDILAEKYSPVGDGYKYTYTLTKYVVEAMHEFAAQEVEAYKSRLKEAIHGYYMNSFREKEFCGIIDEIDERRIVREEPGNNKGVASWMD